MPVIPNDEHLDDGALVRLLDLETDDAECRRIQRHLDACADCRGHVQALAACDDAVHGALRTTEHPILLPRPRWRMRERKSHARWNPIGLAAGLLSAVLLAIALVLALRDGPSRTAAGSRHDVRFPLGAPLRQ